MNSANKQELKATIAEQFKAMTEYEDTIDSLRAKIRELEAKQKLHDEELVDQQRTVAEAALRWAFDGRMFCLSHEHYMQRGLDAVCGEG